MSEFVIDQTSLRTISAGSEMKVTGIGAFSLYETNGCAFNLNVIGLSRVTRVKFQPESGYTFEYDYTTNRIKVRYEGGAAGSFTFTATPLSTVTNQVIRDNAPETSGFPVYVGFDFQTGNAILAYEDPNDLKPQWIKSSLTSNFYLKNIAIRSRTYNIMYNADPVVNLGAVAVNVRVSGKYGEGYAGKLVAALGTQVASFTDDGTGFDTYRIWSDTNYDQDSFALYYNATLPAGGRIVTNAPNDVYIFGASGSVFRVLADGSAGLSGNYKQIYFDESSGTVDERLFAILDAAANTTETQDGPDIAKDMELTRFYDVYLNPNAATDSKLQANMTQLLEDIYLPVGANRAQKIAYNATAAADGTRLYYETSGNTFISAIVSGTQSAIALHNAISPMGRDATASVTGVGTPASEVPNGTDISALNNIQFEAYGFY
ncbi:MAG: hypothetical protein KBC72_00505 [Acinetobacter sp.]|nr:hypothetical protein [Acinetobacter sp.]